MQTALSVVLANETHVASVLDDATLTMALLNLSRQAGNKADAADANKEAGKAVREAQTASQWAFVDAVAKLDTADRVEAANVFGAAYADANGWGSDDKGNASRNAAKGKARDVVKALDAMLAVTERKAGPFALLQRKEKKADKAANTVATGLEIGAFAAEALGIDGVALATALRDKGVKGEIARAAVDTATRVLNSPAMRALLAFEDAFTSESDPDVIAAVAERAKSLFRDL